MARFFIQNRLQWKIRHLLVLLFFIAICCGWWRDRRQLDKLMRTQSSLATTQFTAGVTATLLSDDTIVLTGIVPSVDDVVKSKAVAQREYATVINNLSVDPTIRVD